MDELVAFVRACVDEDERVAQAAAAELADAYGGPVNWQNYADSVAKRAVFDAEMVGAHIALHDPARVLREVESKRAIVDIHGGGTDPCDAHDASFRTVPCDTLRLLALPYADHPGYREEWKPA